MEHDSNATGGSAEAPAACWAAGAWAAAPAAGAGAAFWPFPPGAPPASETGTSAYIRSRLPARRSTGSPSTSVRI